MASRKAEAHTPLKSQQHDCLNKTWTRTPFGMSTHTAPVEELQAIAEKSTQ